MNDEQAMARCIELAWAAACVRGNQPYGFGDRAGRADRCRRREQHAYGRRLDGPREIVAIRAAERALGQIDLTGGTIYASGEPCWTCSAAIGAHPDEGRVRGPSFWPTGGYTSAFPILTGQVDGTGEPGRGRDGRPPREADAMFAQLGWPPTDD